MDDDGLAAPPWATKPLDEISTTESETEMDEEHADEASARPSTDPPEPAPEVRCMWEDCGETFNDLQPFIAHLHSCTCSCLFFFSIWVVMGRCSLFLIV